MHNLACLDRTWPQTTHNITITAIWYETYILTIGLFGNRQPIFACQITGFVLGQSAQRKAQIIHLFGSGRKQKIGLVLGRINTASQHRSIRRFKSLDIMTRGQTIGTKFTCGCQQIGKFDCLVATNTGNRCFTAQIAIGKIFHHLIAEFGFIIQYIMRNTQPRRNRACIMNINTGTTRAFGLNRNAMIVKLQGDTDYFIALVMQHRCGDG